jgi:hypothetical protein
MLDPETAAGPMRRDCHNFRRRVCQLGSIFIGIFFCILVGYKIYNIFYDIESYIFCNRKIKNRSLKFHDSRRVRGYDIVTVTNALDLHTTARGEARCRDLGNESWKGIGNVNIGAPMGADKELGYGRAASYVDRILRGEKPDDLPYQTTHQVRTRD